MQMQNHRDTPRDSDINLTAPAGSHTVDPADIDVALGHDAPTPLGSMLACARRVRYAAHETLYHQGSSATSVTFITAGLLKLIVHLPNGRARIVRVHRAGSILGLGGLLDEENEHTAVALSPVTALRLPLSAVRLLRREDPEAYIALIERWHGYLKEADIWITRFSTGPIRGRVARLLAFLADINRDSAVDQLQLLTCEEMGSVLGVTSESTSRVLADFKRRHILVSDNVHTESEIYNADMRRLRQIAEEL